MRIANGKMAEPRCRALSGSVFLFLVAAVALPSCAKGGGDDAGDVLAEGECAPGSTWCDGNWLIACVDGTLLSELPCPSGTSCVDGECKAKCEAGKGFCAGTIAKMCNETGTAYSLTDCAPGICVDGKCGTCYPGTKTCLDEETVAMCAADGSKMTPLSTCNSKKTKTACAMGQCVSMCAVNLKEATNVGCEYWAVDLDNYYSENEDGTANDAQNSPYAVVVSNVHKTVPAIVEVSTAEGYSKKFEVPAGKLQVLPLESRNVDASILEPLAYRITSDIPIIAYQFNPLSNVEVFSNDASMLIPSGSLGKQYHVMAYEQTGDNNRGFVAVVGTEPGTEVTVTSSCQTLKGDDPVGSISPWSSKTYLLEPYSVLNLETSAFGDDLTGTVVSSNKPVAVFSGSECSNVPNTIRCEQGKCAETGFKCSADQDCPGVCCCDHLEEQLLPSTGLGLHYVASRSQPRGKEMDYWRILATEDDTKVTLTPAVAQVPFLAKNAFVEFGAMSSFEIHATKPVMVGQFLAGEKAPKPDFAECVATSQSTPGHCQGRPDSECASHYDCGLYCELESECNAMGLSQNADTGDPSFILQIPVESFRKDYVFLIPDKYAQDFVNIVLPVGAKLWVDDKPIPTEGFELVGTGEYRVARSMMTDGVHGVRSNRPIGITVYGYDRYVSYGYPAGMSLKTLAGEQ